MNLATFRYKAATTSGEIVDGVVSGSNRSQAIAELQRLGHVPIRVDESSNAGTRRRRIRLRRERITDDQIAQMTRELSTLLHAGLPLDKALAILASLAGSEALKSTLDNVRERVKQGDSLAGAMEAQDAVFGRLYLSLLRAGEAGGALETVLSRLADHMERAREMRSTLTSALMYPAILLVVSIVSILILLGYVVPQFTMMFDGMQQTLPLSTRITIATGEGLKNWGWLLILCVIGGVALVKRQLANPRTALRWHGWVLMTPLLGPIVVKMEVARFAHTMRTLLKNGIPLLNALAIAKDTMGNKVMAAGIDKVSERVRDGQRLADPLADIPQFPSFAVHMIRVGEESGELDTILGDVAQTFDRETQVTIKRAMTLLEPMLILVLGVAIAAVIISILVAILSINELVI